MKFGEKAFRFVDNNAKEGDICVTNIIFETPVELLMALKKGVQHVHVVHSLYPMKLFNHIKYSPHTNHRNVGWHKRITAIISKAVLTRPSQLVAWADSWLSCVAPAMLSTYVHNERKILLNSDKILVPSIGMIENLNTFYDGVPKDLIVLRPWGLCGVPPTPSRGMS